MPSLYMNNNKVTESLDIFAWQLMSLKLINRNNVKKSFLCSQDGEKEGMEKLKQFKEKKNKLIKF